MHTVPSFFVFFLLIFSVTCEDVCEVDRVQNGEILREVLIPTRNSSGHQTGTKAGYFQVAVGSFKDTGSSLYVRCNDPYRFQGDRAHEFAEIICRNGKWVPFPVCLLPPCNKRSLNYRGLDKGGQKTYFHGESFEPKCQQRHKVTEKADKRIHCENGEWIGNLPPCTREVQCKLPDEPDFGSLELFGDSAVVGSVVVFKCDAGRKLVGSVVSTCNKVGEWTSPTPRCIASCKTEALLDFDGLLVENRRRLDDGEWFQPRCDVGYEIANGNDSKIYCRNGEWMGNLPPCVPAEKSPCKMELLSRYEGLLVENRLTLPDGEWFQPRCDEGYEVAEKSDLKIYCRDGQWEGTLPPCAPTKQEADCELPEKPQHGSVKLIGKRPSFLTSVIFSCDTGRVLVGYVISHCTSAGEWTSPPPRCVATCEKETLSDFEGLSVEGLRTLHDEEWFQPTCDEGYELFNENDSKIFCRDGRWEGTIPPCSPVAKDLERCEIPAVPNGALWRYETETKRLTWRPVLEEVDEGDTLNEGESVILQCNDGYVSKGQTDEDITITCLSGHLSPEPECVSNRCDKKTLNSEGLVPTRGYLMSGESFEPVCLAGYTAAEISDKRIYCHEGAWTGNLHPCTPKRKQCKTESLLGFSGMVLPSSRVVDDGDWIEPMCSEGYEFVNKNSSEVYCRNGRWEGTLPPCYPAPCLGNPPVPENGRIKPTWWEVDHGATVEYECLRNLEMSKAGNVVCNFGTWTGSVPTCKANRCDKETLNFEGLVTAKGYLMSGESFEPVCLAGYTVTKTSSTKIYCHEGAWTGNLPPCTPKRKQCETESLLGFAGMVLSSSRVVDDGDWIEPMCSEGYEFVNKNSSKVYCRDGRWVGALPPCYPAPCLGNPPVLENGRIKPTWSKIDHGATVEYDCLKNFEMSKAGNVVCNFGSWTGSVPICKDRRCFLKNLPHKEGVDLSDDQPVRPFRKPNIVCLQGYSLKYPDIRCVNGDWQIQNNLSPCQRSGCEVTAIESGEMLKVNTPSLDDYSSSHLGADITFEQAAVGSFVSHGESVYVSCFEPYKFQGEGNEDLNEVTCQSGRWIPSPECLQSSTCFTNALDDLLPRDIVRYIDENREVPIGFEVKLDCFQNEMVFIGNSNALCDRDGTWRIDRNIHCSHGCDRLRRHPDSELIMSSDKEFYLFGESITFECPKGKTLTTDTERMVCLKYGWEPVNMPDCR